MKTQIKIIRFWIYQNFCQIFIALFVLMIIGQFVRIGINQILK